MELQEEIKALFKNHSFSMATRNNETWEATLEGDGVKMKVDYQSRLTPVK